MTCPTSEIERAAEFIRTGRLVGFPTETVYGLGANALNACAVESIFEAKGRPKTSPLIVHVSSIEMARSLAAEWPDIAERLAQAFWPGPLTLVVRKRADIPDIVTAGLDTVGLRMPAHPVALDLLRAAGLPIAAPSANRFTELSPVTAQHVRDSLGDRVELILDGGTCSAGIESTVLSVVEQPAMLLRPGMVSAEEIEALIGPILRAGDPQSGAHQSPGQHARHYRPHKPLYWMDANSQPRKGQGAFIWRREMPASAVEYAARLYGKLHELDHGNAEWIGIERLPQSVEWEAVNDRLKRAVSG